MNIEEVLREMRGHSWATCPQVSKWAKAIEAAMQEGDAWGRELVVRNRELTDAQDEIERLNNFVNGMKGIANTQGEIIAEQNEEIERLKSENALLRTGDTCARHCEGVAFRHEAQRLTKVNERLRREIESANADGEAYAEIAGQEQDENERLRALLSHWYEMWNDGIPNPDGDVLYDTGAALAGKEGNDG